MSRPAAPKLLLAFAVFLVLLAVGLSLRVLDSPAEERRRRLDEQRTQDLHDIADAVESHWRDEGRLPADLDAVTTWDRTDPPRRDPVSDEPYGYRPTGDDTFELCADFATATPEGERRPHYLPNRQFWQHPAGVYCFEVELEPGSKP